VEGKVLIFLQCAPPWRKSFYKGKFLIKKKFSLNYFLIRNKLGTVPVQISDKSVTTQLPSVWRIFQLFKILQGLQSSSGIRLITSKGWLNAKRDGITKTSSKLTLIVKKKFYIN